MSLISHESGCALGAKSLLPAPDPNLNHHRGHFPQLSGDGLIYGGRLDQQPHPSPPPPSTRDPFAKSKKGTHPGLVCKAFNILPAGRTGYEGMTVTLDPCRMATHDPDHDMKKRGQESDAIQPPPVCFVGCWVLAWMARVLSVPPFVIVLMWNWGGLVDYRP